MPAPTGLRGTSASSRCCGCPSCMARAGPRRPAVLPRAPGRRRAVPCSPGARPSTPTRRADRAARPGRSAPPTRPSPSTGSRLAPTARSSPSARARAAPRTRCCACSTPPTARDLGDAIPDTRACSVAWEPDGSGFVYTRYPGGRRVPPHGAPPRARRRSGTTTRSCGPSTPIRRRGRTSTCRPTAGGARPRDGRLGRARRPPARPPAGDVVARSIAGVEATSTFEFAADGTSLVGVTTLDAPRGRVVARRPRRHRTRRAGTTLVAEGDAVLAQLAVAGDEVCGRRRHARRRHASSGSRPTARRSAPVDGVGELVAVAGLDRRPRDAARRSPSSTRSTRRRRCGGSSTAGRRAVVAGRRRPTAVVPTLTVSQVDVPVARRHDDRDVPDPPRRRRAGPDDAGDPQRLRRVRHRRDAGVVAADRRVVRGRRPVRHRRPARRARARRGVAPRRPARQQAERVRRLPRRRRLARRRRASPAATGWPSSAGRTAGCSSAPR